MSGFTAAGISHTLISTDQQAPLGFKMSVPSSNDGIAVYTYVKAAAEIAAGISCARGAVAAKAGYGAVIVATSAMADTRYVGVAQATIASASYGFVLTKGIGNAKVNSESAISDELVMHSANGELDDAAGTVTNGPVGNVLGTLIAAAGTGAVYVDFAG